MGWQHIFYNNTSLCQFSCIDGGMSTINEHDHFSLKESLILQVTHLNLRIQVIPWEGRGLSPMFDKNTKGLFTLNVY